MQISKITKEQWVKVLKALLYVSASAVLSYLVTLTTENPDLFGPLTIVINGLLVTVKQLFTKA